MLLQSAFTDRAAKIVTISQMNITIVPLLLELLIISIFDWTYIGTGAYPFDREIHWISVHRHLNAPDTIHFTKCLSPISACSTISESSIVWDENSESTGTQQCSCQCKTDAAAFLPSLRSCINKLDECRQQIPFQINDDRNRRWLPTFSIPATNNIFAPTNKILWNEVTTKNGNIENGSKCFVNDVFVQTDNLWILRNNSLLFKLESYNRTNYLMWKGNEKDAKKLEGSIVQLNITCNNADSDFYCLAFRIAGVQVNSNLVHRLHGLRWNRVELIICLLLTLLFGITLCGGIILWKVCWKSKKTKLISSMQMQFIYHMKQQQLQLRKQIASIKASVERQSSFEKEFEQPRPTVSMHRRKLYFSDDFFEPELMANPPPLAVQFLDDLRKMIDIAKDRLRMRRHAPTLTTIYEDREIDDYLEISRPVNRMIMHTDEPSPISLKSVDSGCDSMSDDDAQNQRARKQDEEHEKEQGKEESEENNDVDEIKLEKESWANDGMKLNSNQHVNDQTTLQPSKIPTIDSLPQREMAVKTTSNSKIPSSSQKTFIPNAYVNMIKAIYEKQNGENLALEKNYTTFTSKLPTLIPLPHKSSDWKQNVNKLSKSLPDNITPSTSSSLSSSSSSSSSSSLSSSSSSSSCRNRLHNGRRKAYAVFPNNDLIIKKSLPRRSKRQQRSTVVPITSVQPKVSPFMSISAPSSSSLSLS